MSPVLNHDYSPTQCQSVPFLKKGAAARWRLRPTVSSAPVAWPYSQRCAGLRLYKKVTAPRPDSPQSRTYARVAAKRVNTRLAVLHAPDVQRGGSVELDLRPFQVADFTSPQTVSKRDQDQGAISVAVAPLPGLLDQLFDFGRCQIFAGTKLCIRWAGHAASRNPHAQYVRLRHA
jgi:hypothetical protein